MPSQFVTVFFGYRLFIFRMVPLTIIRSRRGDGYGGGGCRDTSTLDRSKNTLMLLLLPLVLWRERYSVAGKVLVIVYHFLLQPIDACTDSFHWLVLTIFEFRFHAELSFHFVDFSVSLSFKVCFILLLFEIREEQLILQSRNIARQQSILEHCFLNELFSPFRTGTFSFFVLVAKGIELMKKVCFGCGKSMAFSL